MSFLHKRFKSKLIGKTAIISTMTATTLALSNSPMAFADSDKTTTYQVYVNGTYAGNVANKKLVDQIMAEKTAKANDYHIKTAPKIQYIPERTIYPAGNNHQTSQPIKDVFQLKMEAAAIIIDGKPVAYVDSKETAQEVIKDLKLQYVTKDQLDELEARKALDNTSLPPLKENETRLLDVRLSKKVSIEEQTVELEKMMSLKDALIYLQKGTLQEKEYQVQEGDVLETIAHQHDLKLGEILELNPGLTEETLLKIGQKINITEPAPFVEVIVEKETNQKETIPYTTKTVEDSAMPKGQTKIKQEGEHGNQSVTYKITEQNGSETKKEKISKQILKQPVKRIIIKGTKVIPSHGEGSFAWPTAGGYISSQMGYRWGKLHKGIDIARPSDRTIKAADNGIVVSAGWGNGYGNRIIIDHQNGYRTLYGHMSSLKVKAGQTVSKGMAIGIMGSTGDSTGVHLHFEVYKNGSLVNPLKYVNE